MTTPTRIQRRRTKGWRMPENTIYVGRGSRWGNPKALETRALSADWYRRVVGGQRRTEWYPCDGPMPTHDAIRAELAGKNLACWCPLDQPCHADVLLELANQETP
ncbi:DUF4326 domain-containing protein [Timonella senegalensis]|uniref:DUF4326 domain-containing protein n=1 Tax=Timonella senegalensis TaxID=1465825 RepID=UPI002FDCFEAC